MSRNRFEVVGTVLTGFLVTRFLALNHEKISSVDILQEAEEVCRQAEADYQLQFPESQDGGLNGINALSEALKGLAENFNKPDLLQWLSEYSNSFTILEIHHPSQGFVINLLPLALYCVLHPPQQYFGATLTHALSHGRETEILGALTGAWAGALYGFDNIPEAWKTALVNAKEIRLRAESLSTHRIKKEQKDLVTMEAGLTSKEFEESKRNPPKESKKSTQIKLQDLWDDDETPVPSKEDRAEWRKFQKDKTRSKRDRRKNIPFP
jgi:hypothetical protein